jgi:hypothetical protein
LNIPDRETSVFSTSAIDLFASALGAFILLVMLLFPFYRHAGDEEAFARTRDVMEQRRLAAGQVENLDDAARALQRELETVTEANLGMEMRIARTRNDLRDLERQVATVPATVPAVEPVDEPTPPTALTEGLEFSILGLATESKSFVIVIDMSGSMMNYEGLMLRSVLDVLAPLNEGNRFAILGYQGNPQPVLWRFPGGEAMLAGSEENLRQAAEFTRGLARKFVGSTPTHYALQAALEYPANAIILMSDGEPNSPPGYILESITRINQFRQTELHTVAIGDYTHNRNLVMFLQTLSRLNNGDFVGVSR